MLPGKHFNVCGAELEYARLTEKIRRRAVTSLDMISRAEKDSRELHEIRQLCCIEAYATLASRCELLL